MKNRSETIIHETGRALNEHRATLYPREISEIESECIALYDAIVKNDINKMKEGIERVKKSAQKIGQTVYTGKAESQHYSGEGPKASPST